MRCMYFCTKYVIIYICAVCVQMYNMIVLAIMVEKRTWLSGSRSTARSIRVALNIIFMSIYIRWCPQSFAKLLLVDY